MHVDLLVGPLWVGTPLYPASNRADPKLIFDTEMNYIALNDWNCYDLQYCDDYLYKPSASSTSSEVEGKKLLAVTNQFGSFEAVQYKDKICVDKQGSMCVEDYQFYSVLDSRHNLYLIEDVEGVIGLATGSPFQDATPLAQ